VRTIFITLEVLLVVAAICFGIAWVNSPDEPYEPYFALLIVLGGLAADFGRRRGKPLQKQSNSNIGEKTENNQHVSDQPDRKQHLAPSDSASFFSQRFSAAFPGVRKITWYDGSNAIRRLEVLMKEQLVFQNDSGKTTPIWWWRDGNYQISKFKKLSRNTVLLDTKELKVRRLIAVPYSSYYRCFVYLEAAPMKPCGAYKWTEAGKLKLVQDSGYAWEEYGLYKGKHAVTRTEFDDNAAEINGKLVTLNHDVELRERYITPYNLLIAPHGSPINNKEFDYVLRDFMNRMLQDKANIEELYELVQKLPKFQR
jgi:hypothetical protein